MFELPRLGDPPTPEYAGKTSLRSRGAGRVGLREDAVTWSAVEKNLSEDMSKRSEILELFWKERFAFDFGVQQQPVLVFAVLEKALSGGLNFAAPVDDHDLACEFSVKFGDVDYKEFAETTVREAHGLSAEPWVDVHRMRRLAEFRAGPSSQRLDMVLHRFPTELVKKILELCQHEESPSSKKKRLSATVPLASINQRIREISFTCPDIWSTIYLQWPEEVVAVYLHRAKKSHEHPALTIYLDPRDSRLEDLKSNMDRWESFLKQNMAFIKTLDVVIHNENRKHALALALNTPAPALLTCSLVVANKVHLPTSLFSKQAPQLRNVTFRSNAPYDFGPASSLRVLDIRLNQENARGFLNLIKSAPGIESLTLVCSYDAKPISSTLRKPLILSQCRALTIRNMHWTFARYLMSMLRLPALDQLYFHEVQELSPEDPAITLTSALTSIGYDAPADRPTQSIIIDVHPHRAVVSTDGSPRLAFVSDWQEYERLAGDVVEETLSRRILTTLDDVLAAPAYGCHIQPKQLVLRVHNNRNNGAQNNGSVTSAFRQGIQPFLLQVLRAYPSVEVLQVPEHVMAAVKILLDDPNILPHLGTIQVCDAEAPDSV
ncbi:hypothetical protein SISNIDRAFT_469330 [Sistotremastrum niveocremeum HHB9708]|uniref:Uncharacterized protein n=1 Tax=Sistotremastrum niveocremeum HHB9708 TaxID=1314777 RepID=A0A164Q311_9AGAM|nr:hypothetical protein SISNIDRAFT_469330 [Sistotremastrum niveocremeum HHB9708]